MVDPVDIKLARGKVTALAIASVLAVLILAALIPPSSMHDGHEFERSRARTELRQIYTAVQTYHLDKKDTATPYPATLHDLKPDYLTPGEFSVLTRNMTVDYFPPKPDSPGTVPLLSASTKNFFTTITLFGEITTDKKRGD